MTATDSELAPGLANLTPDADERDQYIPYRKSDLIERLLASGDLDKETAESFGHFCHLLASIFHFEYFEKLENLKEAYYYFNPELEQGPALSASDTDHLYAQLLGEFVEVLRGANFVEVTADEISEAHDQQGLIRVKVKADMEEFRAVRFFRRGRHKETRSTKGFMGLFRKEHEIEVYDNVVLLVAAQPAAVDTDSGRHGLRPGSVLLKYFRNIPRADLTMLFPNVRVVMSTFDKAMLVGPALAGGIPILMNLLPALTVLFVVVAFYLGIAGSVEDDDLKRALAAMSGLAALGGFLMRQWVKYERMSLKYQKEITDNVYYRNVNNNSGIFDYIIGAAEEQETKEAFLAYYFLLVKGPASQDALDELVETWLKGQFDADIDFEVADGVAKLERFKLIERHADGRLSVVSLSAALARLDQLWDGYFHFNNAQQVGLTASGGNAHTTNPDYKAAASVSA